MLPVPALSWAPVSPLVKTLFPEKVPWQKKKKTMILDNPGPQKPEREHIRQNCPFMKPPFYLPVKIIAMRFLNASVLPRKPLNRNLFWGFPLGTPPPPNRVLERHVLERQTQTKCQRKHFRNAATF